MTKVINIFGGPGVGKSRNAAALFVALKDRHIPCELTNEYAKEMTYEGRNNILSDQLYILAKQNRKIIRLKGKVDYIISDSPIPTGLAYMPQDYYKSFPGLVREIFTESDNINFLLIRNPTFPYQEYGRNQNEEQAKEKDNLLRKLLSEHTNKYTQVMSGPNCVPTMLKELGIE